MKHPVPDLSSFWMPFTNNRHFKANPRLFVSAEGMYYQTIDGSAVLDATAGLWCVNAGHGRRPIIDAIKGQAETLDFAPTFQLGHPKAFEHAERIVQIMPKGLNRIFFTNSGSESADTALKIALAYQQSSGQASRTRLIGRERGYHGTNFGGTSVGGIGGNRRTFGAQVWGVDHLAHTYEPGQAFTRGMPDSSKNLADELERLITLHGAETIAAVIVEPVAGSTGVLIPPKGYLQRLRELTARNGILLIFDEVITGFGRLGTATAAEYFDVVPDILTMAKGLTNGAVPMGAVAVKQHIYDTVVNTPTSGIEFFHGYTYSGHPLAAAAGIATLNVYRDDRLFQRAATLASTWEILIHSLRSARHIIDIRNIGLIGGIELASRPDAPGARALEVFHRCFDEGVLIRVTGDIIALSPPLIVTEEEIERIMQCLAAILDVTP